MPCVSVCMEAGGLGLAPSPDCSFMFPRAESEVRGLSASSPTRGVDKSNFQPFWQGCGKLGRK
jgi:hypothetical protein